MSATTRVGPGPPSCTGRLEVTGDEMVAAMDAVGVDGAVLVSPFTMYRYNASYAIGIHAAHPSRLDRILRCIEAGRPRHTGARRSWPMAITGMGIAGRRSYRRSIELLDASPSRVKPEISSRFKLGP